jgi:probable rRNA maturation factor
MHSKQLPRVQFHFLQKASFTDRTLAKEVVKDLFKKEKKRLAQLTYIFCSDDYLLQINKQYLQHNYFTDIITFDLSDGNNLVTGEVYISLDRVKENAQTYKVSFQKELLRVIFHGALHLCGYGDKSEKEEKAMRKAEDKYLHYYLSKIKQYVPRGTVEK